jgi:hypothetical protein
VVDLKTAVESGRRWRHPVWDMGWRGPGVSGTYPIDTAISSDFEIEPEPEKPREWVIHTPSGYGLTHVAGVPCPHEGQHFYEIRVHDVDACDRLRGKP